MALTKPPAHGLGLMALSFMRPDLSLPPSPHRAHLESSLTIPASFDARSAFPGCAKSIGHIRNQGHCGSCWAFAAVESLADRICVSSSGTNTSVLLSAQSLIDCDTIDQGCHGGFLDSAWKGLVSRGALQESCDPYKHCSFPASPNCSKLGSVSASSSGSHDGGQCPSQCAASTPLKWFRAASAYAVSEPGDVSAMQRELMAHGPFEVAFYVFSDFYAYKGGVYVKGPNAHGPLGGHAVKLVGWGDDPASGLPYWLIANSWSPGWGESGFFRIVRGTNECGIETTPAAGLPASVPVDTLATARAAPVRAAPVEEPVPDHDVPDHDVPAATERPEGGAAMAAALVEQAVGNDPARLIAFPMTAPHEEAAPRRPPMKDAPGGGGSSGSRGRTRPNLQTQFSATMRLAQTDHGPDDKPGDGCILARALKPAQSTSLRLANSSVWFDAIKQRIAQVNAQYAAKPARKGLTTIGRYDLPSKASLFIEPFFNSTVCYAQHLKGMCPNGTAVCPPDFGHFGDFGTPFTGLLGMYYLNTSFLQLSESGDEVWQWTDNRRTLMANGSYVIITRNYTYHLAPEGPPKTAGVASDASAPRMLRRLEWTQGLPNGGSHAARLCTVIDFTQDYVAGPPPDSEFEPADGIGSCVWTRRRE